MGGSGRDEFPRDATLEQLRGEFAIEGFQLLLEDLVSRSEVRSSIGDECAHSGSSGAKPDDGVDCGCSVEVEDQFCVDCSGPHAGKHGNPCLLRRAAGNASGDGSCVIQSGLFPRVTGSDAKLRKRRHALLERLLERFLANDACRHYLPYLLQPLEVPHALS